MKKPYFIWLLLMGICTFLVVADQVTVAFADQEETEAGISFNQFVEQDKQKPPLYETKPITDPTLNGALPHLGQMMTSFILLLLGVACLIIFLGVVSLRKVYNIRM
ncbi:hypothetical protein [Enterococcus caccae]|uniref:LPXTG-domain-containing protein cell wall anchor domain n=1 Tax=Enterococcus caccae ATCC BAA-1240 TaxID=1158612 RepID=R3TYW7_9ENTE|nr:hypothetical protein [Enterococcus caccae]EOL46368.1 hypothetical protein UC7_01335 [Enterococcus caccae ATCC BAA-1240]EOT60737.1 hypothetical protein I580_01637 [Enterococcus caccae ATCC BAA-1240]OJG27453.1 hypothetical protein RU98_GL002542 [Enterococcus caccae]